MQKKVFYENEGQKIAAVLHTPEKESNKGVILLHGFTRDKDNEGGSGTYPVLAKRLCDAGFHVLRFDCRGSGESNGKFEDMTLSSEASDLKKSIEFMRKKGMKKIAVVGSSLGGCVTLLAYENNMDCMVLWYPALALKETKRFLEMQSSLHELKKEGRLLVTKSEKREFHIGIPLYEEWVKADPHSKLSHVKCPLLIVTGDKDASTHHKHAVSGIEKVKAEKKLVIVKGSDHSWRNKKNEIVEKYREQALAATVDWIKKYLK